MHSMFGDIIQTVIETIKSVTLKVSHYLLFLPPPLLLFTPPTPPCPLRNIFVSIRSRIASNGLPDSTSLAFPYPVCHLRDLPVVM